MVALAFLKENGFLAGLAPFYVDHIQTSFCGKLAHLRLIGDGSGDSDNLDLIARPGYEGVCAQVLLHWLKENQAWDVCSLNTVFEASLTVNGLLDELERAHWAFTSGTCPCSAIHLPRSWAQYVEQLSPEFRPLVTRYPRKLAAQYQVNVRRCENSDDLATGLETLFSLHTRRWNLANEPGSFISRQRKEFYLKMGQCFLRKGWLELWLLDLNGTAAAAQFCFRYRDTVYILQEGFDPTFSAEKVGYALRAAMLKHFVESGVRHYDFLGGLAIHKQKWGAMPGAYLNLRFARPKSLGSFYLSSTNAMARGKEWLRANLPQQAWNALHWLSVSVKRQRGSSPSA
ncbi:MAG TPA: GNAT family N-acetyltransferase [Candidatus Acidoferrum sp.]|nr:GNAT family N-acetyltransferase [Candidatus Acidoferrum sp.]